MYAKVPSDVREPLLKELRQLRLRSAFKHYPALVLIFSSIAALALFVREHLIVRLIRDLLPANVSDRMLASIILAPIVLTTAAALVYFLWKEYKECDCQECLYCRECDAVDKYDDGECPICHAPLQEKQSFYFTTYKDEQKIIQRWGLQACREG